MTGVQTCALPILRNSTGTAERARIFRHTSKPLASGSPTSSTTSANAAAVADAFQRAYADAPFVRVTGEELPEIKHVAHTNFCDVGWKVDERSGRVFIVSVIDNLVKGAAGQAIQNFNVMYGCDQTEGLLCSASRY